MALFSKFARIAIGHVYRIGYISEAFATDRPKAIYISGYQTAYESRGAFEVERGREQHNGNIW
jgi:hypothetical protein